MIIKLSNIAVIYDGAWSEWGAYEQCSVSCGIGFKTRARTCTNPIPSHGGEACLGESTETASCNVESCIGNQIKNV